MSGGDVSGPLGSIKLTLQKFYRVNGGSTQLRGVSSDIVLPDLYEHYKIREKDQPDALPWDEMPKADYATWKYAYDINYIRNESEERTRRNPTFSTISGNAAWLDKQNDKQYPLNLEEYRMEQVKIRASVKQIDSVSKLIVPMNMSTLPEDVAKYDKDKDKADRYKAWLDSRKNDIYLKEAVNVMDDMISRKNLVYNQ
jgi:carboxyl-terminal processing protease